MRSLNKAINSAVTETVFRFELVLRITNVSHEHLVRLTLLEDVFSTQLALLHCRGKDEDGRASDYLHHVTELRNLTISQFNHGRQEEMAALSSSDHSVRAVWWAVATGGMQGALRLISWRSFIVRSMSKRTERQKQPFTPRSV